MLANSGKLQGKRVLHPESVVLMTKNWVGERYPSANKLEGWAFGVETRTRKNTGKVYGWGGFCGNVFFVFPKSNTIGVLMLQQTPNSNSSISEEFEDAVAKAAGGS